MVPCIIEALHSCYVPLILQFPIVACVYGYFDPYLRFFIPFTLAKFVDPEFYKPKNYQQQKTPQKSKNLKKGKYLFCVP